MTVLDQLHQHAYQLDPDFPGENRRGLCSFINAPHHGSRGARAQ